MANNCYYQAQISGKRKNILELIEIMRWDGIYVRDGLGRVFDLSILEEDKVGDYDTVKVEGDCAWSILSSMIDCASKRNLLTETKSLNLKFEGYSEELGACFQEHIVIDCGVLKLSDCVNYQVYDRDDLSPNEIKKICKEHHLTQADWLATEDDGRLTVGGFSDWNFSDPLEIEKMQTKN